MTTFPSDLDARCAAAMLPVLDLIVAKKQADSLRFELYLYAQQRGWNDFQLGVTKPSNYLMDQTDLQAGWKCGHEDAAMSWEVHTCCDCQDPDVQICPFHDCR